VSFTPEGATDAHFEIHAALLAGAIDSDVRGGENRGRKLNYDFVVVNLLPIGMTSANGMAKGKFILNPARIHSEKTLALTAWITRAGELEPLQSTGGWLVAPANN